MLNLILLLLCSLSFKAVAFEVPAQICIKKHFFSLSTNIDVETADQKIGTLYRKFSWVPQYLFYDVHQQLRAQAQMRYFSLGAIFDVWDEQEVFLGSVHETLLNPVRTFDIYNTDGYHAVTASLNLWETKYTLKDPQTGEVIAYLWRKFFDFKNDWSIDIINSAIFVEKKIDPYMFFLVTAYHADCRFWYSYANSKTDIDIEWDN